MNDVNLTIKGFWCTPHSPQNKWFGELNKTSKSIVLTCYAENADLNLEDVIKSQAVHGFDEKDRPITLFRIVGRPPFVPGKHKAAQLRFAYMFRGSHFDDLESLKASSVTFAIQQLDGWVGMTGFSRNLKGRISADEPSQIHIEYRHPNPVRHELEDGLAIEFHLDFHYSVALREQSIREDAFLRLTKTEGLSFQEAMQMGCVFKTLLSFASLRPVYMVSMQLHNNLADADKDNSYRQGTEVFSPNFHEPLSMEYWESRWVFRYQHVASHFESFFNNWLKLKNQYAEAIDCYSTTVYHRLPASVECLCLTQALDAYHGVRFNSHADPDFKKKLKELAAEHKSILSEYIYDISDFTDKAHASRNYYTHHNPKWLRKGNVVSGVELIRMNEKLRILFQICIISEMNIAEPRFASLKCQIATEIFEY